MGGLSMTTMLLRVWCVLSVVMLSATAFADAVDKDGLISEPQAPVGGHLPVGGQAEVTEESRAVLAVAGVKNIRRPGAVDIGVGRILRGEVFQDAPLQLEVHIHSGIDHKVHVDANLHAVHIVASLHRGEVLRTQGQGPV